MGVMRVLSNALLLLATCATGLCAQERTAAAQGSPSIAAFELRSDMDSVDPAVSYLAVSWQLEYATCAKLLNYADDAGVVTLVPEIAAQMPHVSFDGIAYTFVVRGNFQFSPPSNERVTPQVIKRTFERALNPNLFGPGQPGPARVFLSDVISIDLLPDNQIRFTLAQPAGDFVHRVAMPFFCVVPSSTPQSPQDQPPATAGPYSISRYLPAQFDSQGSPLVQGEIVLHRNPNYRGKRPAGFDEIRYATGAPATVDEILGGRADYLPEGVPPDPYLIATYGPDSTQQQLFINPRLGYRYLAINTRRVTDVNVRRAINYAVDRTAIAALTFEMPNDNYLPPGLPAYEGAQQHTYPLAGPDIAMASALLAGAHPSLAMYIQDSSPSTRIADRVAANLDAVGIGVTVIRLPHSEFFQRISDPDEPFDLALASWIADYPDPFEFENVLLDGNSTENFSHFNDPSFNARLRTAAALTGPARTDAYRQLDVDLMHAAPLAVLTNLMSYDFFSSRVHCQVFTAAYGVDLAAVCP